MRLIDIKVVQSALLATVAECRAVAFCGTNDLDREERQALLVIGDLVERQARGDRVIRRTLGNAIDRLIDMLHAIDEPDMDAEPWLAAPETWSPGATDDRELEDEHGTDLDRGEADRSDHEPSLGATEAIDQRHAWVATQTTDLKLDASEEYARG